MPTVRYFAALAWLVAHSCSSPSRGDRYSWVRPSSAACRWGSPVPPHHTSPFGLLASALTWAKVSPELLRVIATLMPVALVNSALTSWHDSICGLQYSERFP